jgi:hypothetical protein
MEGTVMGRKSLAISLTLVLGLIPAMTLAWTSPWIGCDQQNLEGTWSADVWAGDASGIQRWDKCTLTVDLAGVIQPAGTYTDTVGDSAEITGGQLTISAGCMIEGAIETSAGTVWVERGGIVEPGYLVLGTPE